MLVAVSVDMEGASQLRSVREIWGVSVDTEITYDLFMAGIVDDDRAMTQAAVNRATATPLNELPVHTNPYASFDVIPA